MLDFVNNTTFLLFASLNINIFCDSISMVLKFSLLIYCFSQAEPRFLWNNYMLEVLIDNKVELFPYCYFVMALGVCY